MKTINKKVLFEVSLSGSSGNPRSEKKAKEFFRRQWIPENEIVHFEDRKGWRLSAYLKNRKEETRFIRAFQNAPIPGVKPRGISLKEKDWREKWKTDYKIMPLGKRLILIPWWKRKEANLKKRTPIYLDPGSAFGAGTHETTRKVAIVISDFARKFSDFLDIGTGTGILSVAAYRCGAKRVRGIDTDREAVKAARNNLKRNGCKNFRFSLVSLMHFNHRKKYDLVAANLDTRLLIHCQSRIFRFVRPGKYLIISGILKDHFPEIRSRFRHPQFNRIKVWKGRRWVTCVYQRRRK